MAGHSKKVVLVALFGNTAITIIKFVVALITRSAAMLAEAIHSLADTGNQGLLLLGMKRSEKPPDEAHPFGYGKEQYFWSFVVANMLFFVGSVVSIYEGVSKLRHPHPIERAWLIYLILGVSFLIEGYAFLTAYKSLQKARSDGISLLGAIRRSKDTNLMVVLLEDSAALTGLTVAFVGVFLSEVTGIAAFDGLASVLIGLVLAAVSFLLAWEIRSLLIGESATPEVRQTIRQLLEGREHIKGVGQLLTMHLAPHNILVALNLEFADGLTSNDIEQAIDELEADLRAAVPDIRRIFVEADQVVVRKGEAL